MTKSDLRTEILFLAIFITMVASLLFYQNQSIINLSQTHLIMIGFVAMFGFALMFNLSRGK